MTLPVQYVTDVTTAVFVVLKTDVFSKQLAMNVTGAKRTVSVADIYYLNVIPDAPMIHAVIVSDVKKNTNAMYVKDVTCMITVCAVMYVHVRRNADRTVLVKVPGCAVTIVTAVVKNVKPVQGAKHAYSTVIAV